jgi:hypothetical protein
MTHARSTARAGRPIRRAGQSSARPIATTPARGRSAHAGPPVSRVARQARRYVAAAQQHREELPVPEPTVVFIVKLPASLAGRLRALTRATGMSLSALVTRGLEDWLHRVRPGPGGGG